MTCEMCHILLLGEPFDAGPGYIICADRESCTQRFLEAGKTKTEDEPVKEDATQ